MTFLHRCWGTDASMRWVCFCFTLVHYVENLLAATFFCLFQAGIVHLQWEESSSVVSTCSLDGALRLWDARSGNLLSEYRGHTAEILNFTVNRYDCWNGLCFASETPCGQGRKQIQPEAWKIHFISNWWIQLFVFARIKEKVSNDLVWQQEFIAYHDSFNSNWLSNTLLYSCMLRYICCNTLFLNFFDY